MYNTVQYSIIGLSLDILYYQSNEIKIVIYLLNRDRSKIHGTFEEIGVPGPRPTSLLYGNLRELRETVMYYLNLFIFMFKQG